jgi:hypothetical protein
VELVFVEFRIRNWEEETVHVGTRLPATGLNKTHALGVVMKPEDEERQDDKHPRTGSSAPPKSDPSGRPLTEDEKIDEAIRGSFGTSDPPSYSGSTGVGAPKKPRQTDKTKDEEKAEQADKTN